MISDDGRGEVRLQRRKTIALETAAKAFYHGGHREHGENRVFTNQLIFPVIARDLCGYDLLLPALI
jgi:hypothetical protein